LAFGKTQEQKEDEVKPYLAVSSSTKRLNSERKICGKE